MIETIMKTPESVYVDIKEAVENIFGLQIYNPSKLNLGLLNLKWKVESEEGIFVIKQFNEERYKKYDIKKVSLEQDIAIREQLRQYENGTPCPKILALNGNVIHTTLLGERFIMMEHMAGENLLPGTLNEMQMYNLGRNTGQMHNVFNDGTYDVINTPKFVPPSREQRLEHWNLLYQNVQGNNQLLSLVESQIKAAEQFDIDTLNSCDTGWAHRDLWVDNLLFAGNQLSAILDFDRCAFDYPELDIARAIMSGALKEQQFHVKSAIAFMDGYRTKRKLKSGTLVRCLQLLWYLESTWWVTPQLNQERYQEVQFQNEMTWLAENLFGLSEMFGDL